MTHYRDDDETRLGVFSLLCVVSFAVTVILALTCGSCAQVGRAASVLAPYIPTAIEAAERFVASRRATAPAGQCEAIPSELLDGGAAVAVCSPGSGWLENAARVLREAAESDGEGLDIAAAGCFPSDTSRDVIVCVAPYVEE